MNYILHNYNSIKQEYSTIDQVLQNLPFVQVSTNSMKKISEVYNPLNFIFQLAFEEFGLNKFPVKPYLDKNWLKFFKKLGMINNPTRDHLVSACKTISNKTVYHNNVIEQANKLTEIVFGEAIKLSDNEEDKEEYITFINQLKGIAFVPVKFKNAKSFKKGNYL